MLIATLSQNNIKKKEKNPFYYTTLLQLTKWIKTELYKKSPNIEENVEQPKCSFSAGKNVKFGYALWKPNGSIHEGLSYISLMTPKLES